MLIVVTASLQWPRRDAGRLTVNVVDFKEELDLVVGTLPGELVHRVDELLQADAAIVVLVEDVKDPLDEKRLKRM